MNDITKIKGGKNILNNRYELEKKIGEGSYGIVYKAIDTLNNNETVAIKQVSKYKINSSSYLVEALKKELSIMRLISDENSVKLIEDFETYDNYNLVMELCDSDLDNELKERIKMNKKGFNELEVQEIMRQFNKVFLKMQNEQVIHRDLKLKNIMIKYDEMNELIGFIIKLSDFGFSKVMKEDDMASTNLGSPATKAPEVMEDQNYNAKADLWSVGVIMFQLFYDTLPFPANNLRELKIAIFNSKGVKLPEKNNNPMSDICFNLIDRLLQKDPKKRIDFDEYFSHEFFSDEHRKNLLNNEKLTKEIESNINALIAKKEKKMMNKYKEFFLDNNSQPEKRFIKLVTIKKYDTGYILYKAKDTLKNTYVYIKEISNIVIDKDKMKKKIFDKEIRLLSTLKGKKFTQFIGLYKTESNYNIVIEYFSGKNLDDFIQERQKLPENLVILIFQQLKDSLNELKRKRIFLDFISPKSFAFNYYQNETNFEIKFFDYGLNSIFLDEKYTKNFILSEGEIGNLNNSSTNIMMFGLIVCKMLFGDDSTVYKNVDYEIKIKGKINSENKENMKTFLVRSIKQNKRYNWDEFLEDKYLFSQNININNSEKEPRVKDDIIEKNFDIIMKKFSFVINYFDKLLLDKEQILENEIYLNYYNEALTFLLFCLLECKTIIKFLKVSSDLILSKIDKTNQEIHLLKIYLNKNVKDSNKYEYSYINFINEYKSNNPFLYNKENPLFSIYLKSFEETEIKLGQIYNKFAGNNITTNKNNLEGSNCSSEEYISSCSSILNNIEEKNTNDFMDLKGIKINQEGNLEKLFMKAFENGCMYYSSEEMDKSLDELYLAKYLSEYIIYLRVILGNKDSTINFEKINFDNETNNNIEKNNDNECAIFSTFIGGKIKLLKDKGILGYYNSSTDNLSDYIEPKIENIKIYDTMINFYPRIIQFINEIQKGQNTQS